MMPHINDLARTKNKFWQDLTKTVVSIVAGLIVVIVAVIWMLI